jgi:hypothetical protein
MTQRKSAVVLALLMGVASASCGSLATPVTDREQAAAAGAIIGGAGGAIIGSVAGGAVAGGLVGVPVGALAGYYIGDRMSQDDRLSQQERLAQAREEAIEAEIDKRLEKREAEIEARVMKKDAEIDRLRRDVERLRALLDYLQADARTSAGSEETLSGLESGDQRLASLDDSASLSAGSDRTPHEEVVTQP